jgi:hypothetical protein
MCKDDVEAHASCHVVCPPAMVDMQMTAQTGITLSSCVTTLFHCIVSLFNYEIYYHKWL